MPIKFSDLTRPKSLDAGEWVEWGMGLAYLIRPSRNKDRDLYVARRGVEEARKRAMETSGNRLDDSEADFDPEASLDLQMEATAHTVLVGWRGMGEDDGSEMAYSPEKALELFRSGPVGYETYRQVLVEADRIQRAALKVAKDAEGNSGGA